MIIVVNNQMLHLYCYYSMMIITFVDCIKSFFFVGTLQLYYLYACDVQHYCNEDLEWFKSVKGTQASVEVTSIDQLNNISKYGCYSVGSQENKICHGVHEIISLSLQEKDQRLVKKHYNLEELRDLESKLVLITGSKADHRKQVDLFLDVSCDTLLIIVNGTLYLSYPVVCMCK